MDVLDLVTVGHFSIDYIKLPQRHSTRPTLGGPPIFASIAAKNLGVKVYAISKIGEDFHPKFFKFMMNKGIDLSMVKKINGATTTSFILDYHGIGERRLILMNRAPKIKTQDIPDNFKAKAILIAPIVNEVSATVVQKLRNIASVVALDPQGFLRRFRQDGEVYLERMKYPEILKKVDIFKASHKEMEVVTGRSNLTQALVRVHQDGARIVIVTKGAEGALLYYEGKLYQIPAAKPRVIIDPTGSGDVFIGAFLAEYIKEKEPLWCASVGSAAASFIIEKIGASGFRTRKEVYERAIQVYEGIRTPPVSLS